MSTTILPAVEPASRHGNAARLEGDAFPSTPQTGQRPRGKDLSVAAPGGWEDPDLGASTAEYAVIVLAAAAFGGVMAAVLSSDSVSGMLLGIIQKALAV